MLVGCESKCKRTSRLPTSWRRNGSPGYSTTSYDGAISNMRIYGTVLSAQAIAEDKASQCRFASATPSATPSALPNAVMDAWVAGSVVDANTSLPLPGVIVTGSRGLVVTGFDGSFALYAPVVGDRVVVSAGGLPGYSSTTGSAKYDPGVAAYTIPLSLTRFSVQVSFDPAVGLAPVSLTLPSGVFSNNLPYFVSVPAATGGGAGLPPIVTVRVAVIHPSAGPGLLEGASAFAPNGVTRLEVRGCAASSLSHHEIPPPPLPTHSPAACSSSVSWTWAASRSPTLPALAPCSPRLV